MPPRNLLIGKPRYFLSQRTISSHRRRSCYTKPLPSLGASEPFDANSFAMTKYIICSLKLSTGFLALLMATAAGFCFGQDHTRMEGYDLHKTGLIPRYPDDYNCSPLTSLY